MNKALFLDRDGVINFDKGFVYRIEDFIFKKDIFNIIRLAKSKNYKVIIITNQSGIARGYFSEEDYNNLMSWVLNEFLKKECEIDDTYFCPFYKDGKIKKYKKDSIYRKPNPGMILDAAKKYKLDLNKSVLIGDRLSDIYAGNTAGIKTNLLLNENNKQYNLDYKKIRYTEIPKLIDSKAFLI